VLARFLYEGGFIRVMACVSQQLTFWEILPPGETEISAPNSTDEDNEAATNNRFIRLVIIIFIYFGTLIFSARTIS
jgi:hypothetical protein